MQLLSLFNIKNIFLLLHFTLYKWKIAVLFSLYIISLYSLTLLNI